MLREVFATLMFVWMVGAAVGGNNVTVDCNVTVVEIARNVTPQWSNDTTATYVYNCSVPREIRIVVPESHNGTIKLQTVAPFLRIVVTVEGTIAVNCSVSIVMVGLPCSAVNRTDSPVVVTGGRLRVLEVVLRDVAVVEVRNVTMFCAVQSSPWEELRVALLNANLTLLEVGGFVSVTTTPLPPATVCTVVNSTIVMSYVDPQFNTMNRYNYFLAPPDATSWRNVSLVANTSSMDLTRTMFVGFFGVNGFAVTLTRTLLLLRARSFFVFSYLVLEQISITLIDGNITILLLDSALVESSRGNSAPLGLADVSLELTDSFVFASGGLVSGLLWGTSPIVLRNDTYVETLRNVMIVVNNSTAIVGAGVIAISSLQVPISVQNVTLLVVGSRVTVPQTAASSLVALVYSATPHLNGSNRSVLLHPDVLSNVSCTLDASVVDVGSAALVYSSSAALNVSIVLRNRSSVRLSGTASSLLYGEEGVVDSAVTVTNDSSVVMAASDSSLVSVCGPSAELSRLLRVSVAVTAGGSVALLGSSLTSWAFRRNTLNVPLLPLSSGVSLALSNATIVVPLVGAALAPPSASGAQLSLSQAWEGDCVCVPNRTQCRPLSPLTDMTGFVPDVVVMPSNGTCGSAAPSCALVAFQVVEAGSYVYDCAVRRPIEVFATGSGVFSVTIVAPFASVAVLGVGNASLATVVIAVVGGVLWADFRIESAGTVPSVVSVTGAPLLSFALAIANCTLAAENVTDFAVVSSAAATVVLDMSNSTVTLLNVRAMLHLDTVVPRGTVISMTKVNVTIWQTDPSSIAQNWYTLFVGCYFNPLPGVTLHMKDSQLTLTRTMLLSAWAAMSNVSIAMINLTITASMSILVYVVSTLQNVSLVATDAALSGGLTTVFVETGSNRTSVGIDGIDVYLSRMNSSVATFLRVDSWGTFNEVLPSSPSLFIDNALFVVSSCTISISTYRPLIWVVPPNNGLGRVRNLTISMTDSHVTCSGTQASMISVQTYAPYGGVSQVSIGLHSTFVSLLGGQATFVYSRGNASNVTVVMDGGTVAELSGSSSAVAACATASEVSCVVVGSTLSMAGSTSSVVRLVPSAAVHRVDAVSLEVSDGSTIVMSRRSVAEPWLISIENVSDALAVSPTAGSAVRLSQSRVMLPTGLPASLLPPLLIAASGGNVSVVVAESCACSSPINGSNATVCRLFNSTGDFIGATEVAIDTWGGCQSLPNCDTAVYVVAWWGNYLYNCPDPRPIVVFATGSGVFTIKIASLFVYVRVEAVAPLEGVNNASNASVMLHVTGPRLYRFAHVSSGASLVTVNTTLLSLSLLISDCSMNIGNVTLLSVASDCPVGQVNLTLQRMTHVTLVDVLSFVSLLSHVGGLLLALESIDLVVYAEDPWFVATNQYTRIVSAEMDLALADVTVSVRSCSLNMTRTMIALALTSIDNLVVLIDNTSVVHIRRLFFFYCQTARPRQVRFSMSRCVMQAPTEYSCLMLVESGSSTEPLTLSNVSLDILDGSVVTVGVCFDSWAVFPNNTPLALSHMSNITVVCQDSSLVLGPHPLLSMNHGANTLSLARLTFRNSTIEVGIFLCFSLRASSNISIVFEGSAVTLLGDDSALLSSAAVQGVAIVVDRASSFALVGARTSIVQTSDVNYLSVLVRASSSVTLTGGTSSVVHLVPSAAVHHVDAVSLEVSDGSTIAMSRRGVAEPWLISLGNSSDLLAMSSAVRLNHSKVVVPAVELLPPLLTVSGGNVSVKVAESCACSLPIKGSNATRCRPFFGSSDFIGATEVAIDTWGGCQSLPNCDAAEYVVTWFGSYLYNCSAPREIRIMVPESYNGTIELLTVTPFLRIIVTVEGSTAVNCSVSIVMVGLPCSGVNRTDSPVVVTGGRLRVLEVVLRDVAALEVWNVTMFCAVQSSPWEELRVGLLNANLTLLEVGGFISVTTTPLPPATVCTVVNSTIVMSYVDPQFNNMNWYNYFLAPPDATSWRNVSLVVNTSSMDLTRTMFVGFFGVNGLAVTLTRTLLLLRARSFFVFSYSILEQISITLIDGNMTILQSNSALIEAERGNSAPLGLADVTLELTDSFVFASGGLVSGLLWGTSPIVLRNDTYVETFRNVMVVVNNSTAIIVAGAIAISSLQAPISVQNVTLLVVGSRVTVPQTAASLVALVYSATPHLNGSNRSVLLHPDVLSNVSCTLDASVVDVGSAALVYSSSAALNVSIVVRNGSNVRLSGAASSLVYGEEGVVDSAVTVTNGSSVVMVASDSSLVSVCGPSPELSRLLRVSVAVTAGGSVALLGSSLTSWAFRRNTSNVPLLPLSSGVSLTLSNATIVVPLVGAALAPPSASGAQLSLSQAWEGECVCVPNRTQCRPLSPLTDMTGFVPDVVVMPSSGACGSAAPSCALVAFQVVEAGSYVYDCAVRRPIEVYATGSGVFSVSIVAPFASVAVLGVGNASLASVIIAVVGGVRRTDFRIESAGTVPSVVSVTGAPLLSFALTIANCTLAAENVTGFAVVSSAAATVVLDMSNSTVTLLNVRAMLHLDTVVPRGTVISTTKVNVTIWQTDPSSVAQNWYTVLVWCYFNPLPGVSLHMKDSQLTLTRTMVLSAWATMSNVSISMINSTITASMSYFVYVTLTLQNVSLVATNVTLQGGFITFCIETGSNTLSMAIEGVRVHLSRCNVSAKRPFVFAHSWGTFNEMQPLAPLLSIDNVVLTMSDSVIALLRTNLVEVEVPTYGFGGVRNFTADFSDSLVTCSGTQDSVVLTYAPYGFVSLVSIRLHSTFVSLLGGQATFVYSRGNASNVTVVMDGGTVAELSGSSSAVAACATASEVSCVVVGSTLSMAGSTSSVVRLVPSAAVHRVDAVSLEVSDGSTIVMGRRSVTEPWLVSFENVSDRLAVSPTAGSAVRLSQSRVLLPTGVPATLLPPLLTAYGGNVSVEVGESCACSSSINESNATVCRSFNSTGDFIGAAEVSIEKSFRGKLRAYFQVESTVACYPLTLSSSMSESTTTTRTSSMSNSGIMASFSGVSQSECATASSSASATSTVFTTTAELPERAQDSIGGVVAQIAVNVVTLPLTLLSGVGVAMGAERAVLQMKLSACEFSLEDEVDIATNPTRLGIGSPVGRFVRGAVVGNLAIMMSVFALAAFTTWLASYVTQLSLVEAMGLLSLPGHLVAPFAWLLQPTVSMATALTLSQPAGAADLAVGLVALALLLVALCLIALTTTLRFGAAAVRETSVAPHRRGGALYTLVTWLCRREYEWVDADRHDGFVARYGLLFEAYCGQRQWFVNIELSVNVVIAVLVGAIPVRGGASCTSLLYGCVAVNAAMCVVHVVLHPHMSKLESGAARLQYALSFVWSVLALVQSDVAEQSAAAVSQTQIYVSAAMLLMSLPLIAASRRLMRFVLTLRFGTVTERSGGVRKERNPLLADFCRELALNDAATLTSPQILHRIIFVIIIVNGIRSECPGS